MSSTGKAIMFTSTVLILPIIIILANFISGRQVVKGKYEVDCPAYHGVVIGTTGSKLFEGASFVDKRGRPVTFLNAQGCVFTLLEDINLPSK